MEVGVVMDLSFLTKNVNGQNLFASFILLFILWLIKFLITNAIRKTKLNVDLKRKWVVHVRNFSTLAFVIGLGAIWSTQLQGFAISLVAIAAALAIATKELILCFLGGFLRASNHPFSVGDRIEVKNYRGDVIDTNLLTTKIMEIGPFNVTHQYTGRAITIPNSIFLTESVVNESFMDQYVLHVFQVPLSVSCNWKKAENLLLDLAHKECDPYMEEARRNMERIGRKEGLDVPSVDPRVTYHIADKETIKLVVRIPAPATQKGTIEHAILKKFLEAFHGQEK